MSHNKFHDYIEKEVKLVESYCYIHNKYVEDEKIDISKIVNDYMKDVKTHEIAFTTCYKMSEVNVEVLSYKIRETIQSYKIGKSSCRERV